MATDFNSGFLAQAIKTTDGLTLHARDYGRHLSGPLPIICLPGLTRNARDFHQLGLLFSRHPDAPRRVVALDSRGRGLSDWDPNTSNYTIAIETQDVLDLCAMLGIGRAIFIGTSRGGLILHLIAVMKPDILAGVVLNDVGPVLEVAGLRHIQDYLGKARQPHGFDDAAAILQELHQTEFPVLAPDDWQEMAQALYRQEGDRIVSDFDPAIAETLREADLTKPLPDLWMQYEAMKFTPLLVVRGENSKLLSEATVDDMLRRHPKGQRLTAFGQGHAPLLHLDGIVEPLVQFVTACG